MEGFRINTFPHEMMAYAGFHNYINLTEPGGGNKIIYIYICC